MANFLDVLHEGLVLGDGATGTYLYSLGVSSHHCLEELNISQPDLVSRVYLDYAAAGARVIETNSFGGNRARLARFGLDDQVNELNWKAARVAVEALKGKDVFIGGSVGPITLPVSKGLLTADDRRSMYREQMGALLDGGCDLIFIETFTDLGEILLALDVFQNLTNLPVVTSLGVSEEGRLASGENVADAFAALKKAGADVVGINGTCGPQAGAHVLSRVAVEKDDLMSLYVNAGRPEFYEGRFNYSASPEYLAAMLPDWVAQGARLIGGDYGTTPEHIKAMAAVIPSLKPVRVKQVKSRISVNERRDELETKVTEEPSLLARLKHQPVTVVELDSPKTLDMDKFLKGARELKEAGADAITLADNSLAILRVSNFAAAIHLREKLGITSLIHIACRDRNLLGLQSELMGFGTLGFRHVLALTGDPARVGDHPGATSVYDVNSVGLIKILKGMNAGVNAVGKDLHGKTDFVIGCAFNPNALNFDSQVRKLEDKLKAGAQYVLTQPVFDVERAKMTAERLKPLGVPVFIGVMPLLNSRNAEFLHNEVPGIKIPDEIREKMRAASSPEAALQVGMSLAKEVQFVALEQFRAVYLITPFLKYEVSVQLMDLAR